MVALALAASAPSYRPCSGRSSSPEAVVEDLPTQKDLVTLAELQLFTGRTETLARVRVTQRREEAAGVDLDTERTSKPIMATRARSTTPA